LLKVFKRFKQKLDLWAINASYSTLAPPQPDPTQINELHTILKSPDFFQPPDSAAKLHFFNKWQFAFDSSVSLCCPENNRVNGWFIPCGKDWRSRPLVLLLHGWNAEMHYEFILPRLGKRLRKRGMNTIAFELPMHSQRRPSASYRIRNFISDHLPTMLQATRQSLADIHSILLWAKKEGCPGVALWGFSLGAWLAGLYVTVSPQADAAVLTTPITNMTEAIRDLGFCSPIRAALGVAPIGTDFLDLENRRPLISNEKIILQEADYDTFVTHGSYERFASAWGITDWLRGPQSHISILASGKEMQRGVDSVALTLGLVRRQ